MALLLYRFPLNFRYRDKQPREEGTENQLYINKAHEGQSHDVGGKDKGGGATEVPQRETRVHTAGKSAPRKLNFTLLTVSWCNWIELDKGR